MTKTTKKSHQVKNWAQYNNSLVKRGNIALWFSDEAIKQWGHQNQQKRVDVPSSTATQRHSDTAIETLLLLRELFRLPYRQTEGLGKSLVKLMDLDVRIPDFTSLAKRAATMKCSILTKKLPGPIDIEVDSTGLKVYGEG